MRLTEYVVEPTDEYGDILDPCHFPSRPAALAAAPGILTSFPDALYADVARCVRYGTNDEGETRREYHYFLRLHRDGREERLESTPDLLDARVV